MIDPVAFYIFSYPIRWYGIIYATSVLILYLLFLRKQFYTIPHPLKENLFTSLLLGTLIGARLGEFLYVPYILTSNPLSFFYIWQGGLSVHGGIIGFAATLYYLSNKHTLSFYEITDFFAVWSCLFLAFGRIANYINQEITGIAITSSSIFYGTFDFFPLALALALKNFFCWIILYFFIPNITRYKTIAFLFLFNLGRFILDFYKFPYGVEQLFITTISLTIGQLLSLLFMGVAIILLITPLYKLKESMHE